MKYLELRLQLIWWETLLQEYVFFVIYKLGYYMSMVLHMIEIFPICKVWMLSFEIFSPVLRNWKKWIFSSITAPIPSKTCSFLNLRTFLPTSKQSFVLHDDIYPRMSITRGILLNGYFISPYSFFLSTVYFIFFYVNCSNELQYFWKIYSEITSQASEMVFLMNKNFLAAIFNHQKKTCPKIHMQEMVGKWWDFSCCNKNNISMFTYLSRTYLGKAVRIQMLIYPTLSYPILPPLKKDWFVPSS